jgi:glycosyltransferase involved in cell wall biosynthesis
VKVLLTHERFLPDWGGGGETIVYETARGLMSQGVDVRVLTTGDPAQREYEGIPTERIPVHRYRMNFAASLIALRAADADLVQTFNYHACWPSLVGGERAHRPVVCSFLGLFGDAWIDLKGKVMGPLFRAWERRMLKLPFFRLCFLSEYSRRQAISLGSLEQSTRAVCPGVALEHFRPAREKENLVLFVGKFSVRKGVYDVLEVARALPEYRFLMVGWGPEEEALRRLAPSNLTVQRGEAGRPPSDEYGRARVFLFPSRAETLGMVIPEAMASGCAIASCVPLDFHGVRFAPGGVAEMTAAVRRLMSDDGYFEECSEANLQASRFYSWTRYTAELLEVYEQALGDRNPHPVLS